MKCPYCAEEIKDEAILCRFCGAAKEGAVWKPPVPRAPAAPCPARAGAVILRVAAALYLLSALVELGSVTSEIPLFGAVRGGWVAIAHHLVYVALFAALGIGLWTAARWGYRLVFAGTIFYTLDKAAYLLDRQAREACLLKELRGYEEVLQVLDKASLLQVMAATTVLLVVSWWGFAVYVYMRRSYFQSAVGRT